MKIEYFPETDSLYIEPADRPGADKREIEEGMIVARASRPPPLSPLGF